MSVKTHRLFAGFTFAAATLCDLVTLPFRATVRDAQDEYVMHRFFYGNDRVTVGRMCSAALNGAAVTVAFSAPLLAYVMVPKVSPAFAMGCSLALGYLFSWRYLGQGEREGFSRFPMLARVRNHLANNVPSL